MIKTKFKHDKVRSWKLLVSGVVAVVCGFFLTDAYRTWKHFDHEVPLLNSTQPTEQTNPVTGQGKLSSGQSSPVSIDVIVQRNIFGGRTEASKKPEPKIELETIPLAKESRQLRLKGTIVNNKMTNWAIIDDQKKRQQGLYTEGDTIRDITISSIVRNNVVIKGDKGEEILSLDHEIRNAVESLASQESP